MTYRPTEEQLHFLECLSQTTGQDKSALVRLAVELLGRTIQILTESRIITPPDPRELPDNTQVVPESMKGTLII